MVWLVRSWNSTRQNFRDIEKRLGDWMMANRPIRFQTLKDISDINFSTPLTALWGGWKGDLINQPWTSITHWRRSCLTRLKALSVERMCSHFGDDNDRPAIIRQLGCLQDVRQSQTHEVSEPITISTVNGCLQNLGQHKSMFCEVIKLLKLFLILPVTPATAERSFSGLRRLKTFLRTRMTQELLNSLALLHVHKHITYSLDIMKEAKEFVSRSDNRLAFFGHFV